MLNPKDFIIQSSSLNHSNSCALRKPMRPKRPSKPFLCGPVPMDWICKAYSLNGACLGLGVLIWHIAGMRKRKNNLKISNKMTKELGISRQAQYRAIQKLKNAGLISVEQHPGKSPVISIPTPNK